MAQLVIAEGPILTQILGATYEIWHEGLSRAAYGRLFAAQTATAWGRGRLRLLALVDRDELLASAKLYSFEATLDARPIRVAGIGATRIRISLIRSRGGRRCRSPGSSRAPAP